MKLIIENWREYIIQEGIMYHSTDPSNIESIRQAGSWADEYYGTRPVYLSRQEGKYEGESLAIDTSGLNLVADLPSLVDYGANVEEELLWWEEGEEPPELEPYLNMGEIEIFDLMNEPDVIKAAIRTTGTAAVLDDIPPDKIR
jgi:hypothetical protein